MISGHYRQQPNDGLYLLENVTLNKSVLEREEQTLPDNKERQTAHHAHVSFNLSPLRVTVIIRSRLAESAVMCPHSIVDLLEIHVGSCDRSPPQCCLKSSCCLDPSHLTLVDF